MTVSPPVEFDPIAHEYRVNGERWPSVTEILGGVGIIDKRWFTAEACLRGNYVAKATQFDDEGDLDECNQEIMGYVAGWRRFRNDVECKVLAVEQLVVNPRYRYCGTLDRRVILRSAEAVLDIKTGADQDWHALQTAAYEACFDRPLQRFSLLLDEYGGYKLRQHKSANDRLVFLAALTLFNWRKQTP